MLSACFLLCSRAASVAVGVQAIPLAAMMKGLWMQPLLLTLPMLAWLCWKHPRMDKANMLTGPNDTLWNTSTSEPITTGSTSTSEVNDGRIDLPS